LAETFKFEARGIQDVKGKGPMSTYILRDSYLANASQLRS